MNLMELIQETVEFKLIDEFKYKEDWPYLIVKNEKLLECQEHVFYIILQAGIQLKHTSFEEVMEPLIKIMDDINSPQLIFIISQDRHQQ